MMMSATDYAYDHSFNPTSDDDNDPASSSRGIKRGSRACDRCRKLKSKCEPTDGDKCKNCAAAGTPCTFQGPNFKRGPPKGYIHAIEQRWHQVECILGSIMAVPQAQSIISELRNDSFAHAILERVDYGPYGPRGRQHQQQGTSSGDFYATIMGAPEASRDDRRVRRQSRMTREIVSIEDSSMLATPTKEWQDHLVQQLSGGIAPEYSVPPFHHESASPASVGSSSYQTQGKSQLGESGRQRRRLDSSYIPEAQQNTAERYAGSDDSFSNWDELDDTADSFGHLALDDGREIRYHGHASGLPLLARSKFGGGARNADGLWKFPKLKQEETSDDFALHGVDAENDPTVVLPPLDVQNHLVNLYFAYVHPFFPVVHKEHFLANLPPQYSTDSQMYGGHHPAAAGRMPMQKINKLLLLAMFSMAAHHAGNSLSQQIGYDLSKACVQYAMGARHILNSIFQFSRPTTVQALLLLGIREFGIGSMEQGWLYTGMALRMAIDLGLNRNADKWSDHGQDIFTPVEKQIRKQIWWSCCITDKLSAMWMGRPITFRANDYSTLKPDANEEEDHENWQPYPPGILGPNFSPRPSMVLSCYHQQCELSVIITDIMDQIYPVRSTHEKPRRIMMQQLETRLQSWFFNLPELLRYSAAGGPTTPLPHVLLMHIEYYAAVLLLHRAFIPHANGGINDNDEGNFQGDPLPLKSFDICQSSATHISSLASIYQEQYDLVKAPPFLSIYLQSAGIMHVITLTRRPQDTQATIGLRQCIEALEHLEGVWASANRVRKLLDGAKVLKDQMSLSLQQQQTVRRKRSAEEALGADREPDLQRAVFSRPSAPRPESTNMPNLGEDVNTRLMLHTLGLDVPGMEASTSYYPGYQWWPRPHYEGYMQGGMMDESAAANTADIGGSAFTFGQQETAPAYPQGAHYSTLDPLSLFPRGPNGDPDPNACPNPGH